jgi:hypothetical protein
LLPADFKMVDMLPGVSDTFLLTHTHTIRLLWCVCERDISALAAWLQTEMVDMLSADPQELVATVGRCKGLVVMCPPSKDPQAATSLAAMTSAIKKGTKVCVWGGREYVRVGVW